MSQATRTIAVNDPVGLHARPASELVKTVGESGAKVTISKTPGEPGVDAASILAVLSLGIAQGDTVELVVDGEDADAIADRLVKLIAEQNG